MLPDRPPSELVAGDSAGWIISLPEYPAPDWILHYTLVGSDGMHSITAAPSGADHQIILASADTAAWTAGRYLLSGYASRGADRYTISRGELRVLRNPAAGGPFDTRSHARRVLDAIEAFLETGDMVAAQVQIADRRIAQIPIPDLLALRDRYRAEVNREQHGAGIGGRIYTRL